MFTKEINKIALSSNDEKRLQTFDRKLEKCWKSMQNRATKLSEYKMINFDDYSNKNKAKNNLKYPYVPDQNINNIQNT